MKGKTFRKKEKEMSFNFVYQKEETDNPKEDPITNDPGFQSTRNQFYSF